MADYTELVTELRKRAEWYDHGHGFLHGLAADAIEALIAGGDGSLPGQEPIPVLTALSPASAESGSADLVMSCIGTGFTSDTVIKFGDWDEPTTLVSETEVTTGVKPSLFAPATVPVWVHNKSIYSDPIDFTFTAAAVEDVEARQPGHKAKNRR